MIKRFLLFLCICAWTFTARPQTPDAQGGIADSTRAKRTYAFRDSASLARWMARRDSVREARDSIKAISDSLSRVWIGRPDPNRPNQFVDSLVELYTVKDLDFQAWARKFPHKVNRYDQGKSRPKGEPWVIGYIILLLLFFAILKKAAAKEMVIILQSFFSNRILSQISKEANLFSSWPFILLYILFGFTIGMLLYLSGRYFQLAYAYSGIQLLILLSLSVIGLFTLKILLSLVLGYLFDVQRLAREYVSILYLTYFNAAILYLPLILAFSLTPGRFAQLYIYIAIALLVLIFIFQFLRAGINILSNYRFPKMYLFIYLCALEVCPLLILIKALRF
ncbi:DUF4271 domain-containing protein [Hufsiella ginkgonis]|uniref:DUF4271 domain-containing protein n=1 Tax=Hufsiella ginkgonis TaxID=2695274 RepID=A0A7K1Y3G1_9SPHI|nr:DUF4271 domain-containing protein [Hufsiella ginkgonis]MXV17579.1 DUF4271 domain-containing protein [Hufsiella ginkgonis]